MAEKSGTSDEIVAAHRGLAEVFVKTGRFPAAAIQLEAAVDRLEMVRGSAPGPELRSSFLVSKLAFVRGSCLRAGHPARGSEGIRLFRAGPGARFSGCTGARSRRRSPVGLNSAERNLRGRKEVLLDYMLGERESYLWAISGQGTRMVRLPGRARIVSMVEAFRASITVAGPGWRLRI